MEFPKKTAEYKDLKELGETWDVVYGPIQSRRLGTSLGVNLLGAGSKICSFDCPYCEVGLTSFKMSELKNLHSFPSLAEIDEKLRSRLVDLNKQGNALNTISLVGNGEPTLHPQFTEAVTLIKIARDQLAPGVPISILSNGSTMDASKILHSLNQLDERMIKVDAGNDNMLKRINAPLARVNISKIINGAARLTDLIVQAFFVQGAIDNTVASEVEDWIEVVGIIKPKLAHLYTLDRVPPTHGLIPAPRQKLKEIAHRLEKRTQVKALVFA